MFGQPPTTVVLADGDPITRRVVGELLGTDPRFVVAAEAADGVAAVELAKRHDCGLLVTELALPRLSGAEAAAQVVAARPEARIAALTSEADDALLLAALRGGVHGIVDKALPPQEIRSDLAAVAMGETALPPRLVSALVARLRSTPASGHGLRPIRSRLTDREWEIVDLLAAGESTAQVAEALFLTRDTVYSHVKNLMRKLGVRSRREAIAAVHMLREEVLVG